MNDNTKLEVAKEVIASKVGEAALRLNFDLKNEELLQLLKLKDEVDRCHFEAIDFVLENLKLGENNND